MQSGVRDVQRRVQRREAASIADELDFAGRSDGHTNRGTQRNPVGDTEFNSVANTDRRADNNADADALASRLTCGKPEQPETSSQPRFGCSFFVQP